MTRDYGQKKRAQPGSQFLKQVLLVMGCFLLGYLSASFFDATSLSQLVKTKFFSEPTVTVASKPVPAQAALPKPKFEFYTLLANEHEGTHSPSQNSNAPTGTVAPASPVNLTLTKSLSEPAKTLPSATIVNRGAYHVQIASFKSKSEAEKMKAALVLKGFTVNIASVTQQQVNWYRVIMGPFASYTLAEQAQDSVSRSEHIKGMIRKMDV